MRYSKQLIRIAEEHGLPPAYQSSREYAERLVDQARWSIILYCLAGLLAGAGAAMIVRNYNDVISFVTFLGLILIAIGACLGAWAFHRDDRIDTDDKLIASILEQYELVRDLLKISPGQFAKMGKAELAQLGEATLINLATLRLSAERAHKRSPTEENTAADLMTEHLFRDGATLLVNAKIVEPKRWGHYFHEANKLLVRQEVERTANRNRNDELH